MEAAPQLITGEFNELKLAGAGIFGALGQKASELVPTSINESLDFALGKSLSTAFDVALEPVENFLIGIGGIGDKKTSTLKFIQLSFFKSQISPLVFSKFLGRYTSESGFRLLNSAFWVGNYNFKKI